jgi:hypothetical protein
MVMHFCNPSTWEGKGGGSQVLGQPGLHSKMHLKKKKKKRQSLSSPVYEETEILRRLKYLPKGIAKLYMDLIQISLTPKFVSFFPFHSFAHHERIGLKDTQMVYKITSVFRIPSISCIFMWRLFKMSSWNPFQQTGFRWEDRTVDEGPGTQRRLWKGESIAYSP